MRKYFKNYTRALASYVNKRERMLLSAVKDSITIANNTIP